MRKLASQMMLVVLVLFSAQAWAGNNSSYKISPDVNFTPTSIFQKSWEIAYGESQMPVTVFMKETKKGQEYYVRTKYFEVKYVNGQQGFGAKMVTGAECTVSENLTAAVLDQIQLKNQRCITTEAITTDNALIMIASYLPDLINEKYSNILD